MFETVDLSEKLSKEDYNQKKRVLSTELNQLQRYTKGEKIPVMVVIEGIDTSGKGAVIERIIEAMDPRWFSVVSYQEPTSIQKKQPWLMRFWLEIPPKGHIRIFDKSWYYELLMERLGKKISKAEFITKIDEIRSFERTLAEGGWHICKFYLHISKAEQKKRLKKLEKSPDLSWMAGKRQWELHKKYHKILELADELVSKTDAEYAPWNIIPTEDLRYGRIKVMERLISYMENLIGKTFREKAQQILLEEGIFHESLV